MNWERLDIHLENLIPGIAILSLAMIGWPELQQRIPVQGLLSAVSFVGISYMVGAFGNLMGRLFVDEVNKRSLRRFFFLLFAKRRLRSARTWSEINECYSETITAGLTCGNDRVSAEVAKRRQTGRVLRSALIPTLTAVVLLSLAFAWSRMLTLIAVASDYLLLCSVYAYAEVVVFQESYRGLRILETRGHRPDGAA